VPVAYLKIRRKAMEDEFEWYDDTPMSDVPMLIKSIELAEEAGDYEFAWQVKLELISREEKS
jgi:hypothetical protein